MASNFLDLNGYQSVFNFNQNNIMENSEKIQLLSEYVGGKRDILPNIGQNGYGSDRDEDFTEILADSKYTIFSSALEINTAEGNRRFIQVFNQLLQTHQLQVNDEIVQSTLDKILTNETTIPNAPSRNKQAGHAESNITKPFSSLKKNISENNNLELFKTLIGMVNQQNNSRSKIVENLVDSLCTQRTFNKSTSGVITESFNGLLGIIMDHSGGADDLKKNFQKLMGFKKDGSYLKEVNIFFPKEILESFPAEEGFTKMKEFLGLSGITDDEQKNDYIKYFVKNFFVQDAIGIDQEKLLKLDHYIKEACEDKKANIFALKNDIVNDLYNENTSCKLNESFLDFLLNQKGDILPKQMKNLIIHLGSIEKVKQELLKRDNKDDATIEDAIKEGGREGFANDRELLRKVLQKGDENLLKELIGGSQPLINEEQIFTSVNINQNNQSFQPIREAFNKNQDLSSLNGLAFLFSKLSIVHASEILSDLIPLPQNPQNPQAQGPGVNQLFNNPAVDNFLTDLLGRNFNSAKMLIDIANKEGFQDNVKSSIGKFINTKTINGNDYIALLNMVSDNGPLSLNVMQNDTETSIKLEGDALFRGVLTKDKFYVKQDSPKTLLSQNNPASLALFF